MRIRARTVVLSDAAQQAYDRARELPRFEDAYEGLEWLLARTPEVGVLLDTNGTTVRVYVQGADEIAETPEIWVVFRWDEDRVEILAMNVVEVGRDR